MNKWEFMYRGIIIPGFLRWCRISSIHSMGHCRNYEITFTTKTAFAKVGSSGTQRVRTLIATWPPKKKAPNPSPLRLRCFDLRSGPTRKFQPPKRARADRFGARALLHHSQGLADSHRVVAHAELREEPAGGVLQKRRPKSESPWEAWILVAWIGGLISCRLGLVVVRGLPP